MKRAGWKVPPNTVYLAVLCDIFETYVMSINGEKNTNRRADRLMIDYGQESDKPQGMTIDEFNALRDEALKG